MNFSKHWAGTLDDYVIDLAWSPDGALLAAASAAGGINLHDAGTGAVRHALAGHADGTNCLAWMPGQKPEVGGQRSGVLASGGQDGFIRFWDATTGTQSAEVKVCNAWVEHVAWQSIPATDTAGITIDPTAMDPATVNRPPSTVLFAAAGKKLVALRPDGSLAHTFPDAPKTITALAISSPLPAPRSPLLAVAYFGGVCVWDAVTFAAHKEYPYGNTIHALTWSPDGRWLVAGCQDNAVHLWTPAEDLELHMSGYETKLKELSFSHDSKWLATGGGKDACIWDCTGAGPEGREPLLVPHQARVGVVAFQQRHGLLATGAADGEFCLWAPARKNPLIAEVRMPAAATRFAWRHDDTLLAVGTEKGSVFVFRTGE